jgi:hypothetical protein
MMPITMCSQRQPGKTAAMKNSLIMATRNKTPSRAPTVGTEAGVNRSATHDRMSQAMPVSRNIHQGPASRDSPARVLDRVAVRSSMALISSFLSARGACLRRSPAAGGPRLPNDYPFGEM